MLGLRSQWAWLIEVDVDLGLKGKRALVTGSTAGIGLATARGLAAEGARVWINGRTAQRVNAAVTELTREMPGAELEALPGDLGNAAGATAAITRVPELEILVNNLGIFQPKPFEEITDADWLRFFEVNVLSGIRLARHYVRGMRERNWGRIVFVSSESAVQIPTEMIHYGMTKTAQLAVSRGLAETLAGTNVTVNSVLPGPTASEGVGEFLSQLASSRGVDTGIIEREFFEHARPSSILQRFASPNEVAAMIVYVCSAQASATTGAALRVDGGVVRSIV
jgi:NAD(P)-dependent dehydrogenase (short-subunit alcohol dehydrogenase family)